MNIRILAIGKLKEKYWQEALAEYEKRLRPYARLEIIVGPEGDAGKDPSDGEIAQTLKKEGRFFLDKMREHDYNVALDLQGELVTSEDIADLIADKAMDRGKTVTFLIGGSLGLDEAVKKRCHRKIAFGHATFPHQMIRVFLAEQIYRGFKIIRGEPYHK